MTLSARQFSLAQIGALTANGDLENLKIAVNTALDNGLTVNEIQDAMVQLYAYTGFPRSLNALGVLSQTIKVRQEKGIKTELGKIATSLPTNTDMLALGTETQTTLVGQKVDLSSLSPDIDRYPLNQLVATIGIPTTPVKVVDKY
ncbi:carboxymuconolactone decarboxylase family protein [Actinobacillus equuli]|nr:carboxymuconolactone decarboxylase family protein [Actinobacillus equuli]WGE46748.1 carboxymuconolactone decarboxylase family protein [Actinobacillus equuli subsp. haemolyticus]WGE83655.1 carboxymuconolactone decarboxylase family protein [Actinobacillus equuli subsp. equuli]